MTGMWPNGMSVQHHGSHQQQHMQQVNYNSGYPGGPLDIYGAAAGSFDGWALAQAAAAQQYGVSGGHLVGHQHMLPAHHMGGHMGGHQHAMMGGAHGSGSANRSNNMMMHSWGHQHMHMPLMMHLGGSSSPPGGYMVQGSSSGQRGNWPHNQKGGAYGGGRHQGGRGPGQQGGRGNRPRRHIVLNTNPGEQQRLSAGGCGCRAKPAGQRAQAYSGSPHTGTPAAAPIIRRCIGLCGGRHSRRHTSSVQASCEMLPCLRAPHLLRSPSCLAGDFSDAAFEEFAAAVKLTPAGEALDPKVLTNGLANLDSRGLAALLKDLAKERHGRRAREVRSRAATASCIWLQSVGAGGFAAAV